MTRQFIQVNVVGQAWPLMVRIDAIESVAWLHRGEGRTSESQLVLKSGRLIDIAEGPPLFIERLERVSG